MCLLIPAEVEVESNFQVMKRTAAGPEKLLVLFKLDGEAPIKALISLLRDIQNGERIRYRGVSHRLPHLQEGYTE